jgi:hypothetical protein
VNLEGRRLWRRFRQWLFRRWRPWIEFYMKEKSRRGLWYRYGRPASVLLVVISVTFVTLTRLGLVPAQYLPLTVILFLALLFSFGTILVVTSVITMGKLALYFFITGVAVAVIAIVMYLVKA